MHINVLLKSFYALGIIIDHLCTDHLFLFHNYIDLLYTYLLSFVSILNEADVMNKVFRWDNVALLFTSSRKLHIKEWVVTENPRHAKVKMQRFKVLLSTTLSSTNDCPYWLHIDFNRTVIMDLLLCILCVQCNFL